jgi:NADH-quinone oxidoreductase subunit L
MITLVIGSNLLVLFIGWEGVGLLFLIFWHKTTKEFNDEAFMNRMEFRFTNWNLHYRIIILYFRLCYFKTAIAGATDNIFGFLLPLLLYSLEPVVKSAQIPLYTWLPDAIGLTLFSINTCCSNGNTGIFMITD